MSVTYENHPSHKNNNCISLWFLNSTARKLDKMCQHYGYVNLKQMHVSTSNMEIGGALFVNFDRHGFLASIDK